MIPSLIEWVKGSGFRVLPVAQWDQWCLGSTGMQVQFPGQHSGLRIWHCHSCSLGHNCGSDLIPGQGIPHATGQSKKKKKRKQKKLRLRLSTWPGNFPMLWCGHKIKKKRKKRMMLWTFSQKVHTEGTVGTIWIKGKNPGFSGRATTGQYPS